MEKMALQHIHELWSVLNHTYCMYVCASLVYLRAVRTSMFVHYEIILIFVNHLTIKQKEAKGCICTVCAIQMI